MRFWFALAAVGVCQLLWQTASEPFFNGDETRHVMTGVFVRDAILEKGFTHPKSYAESYYAQHPTLGLLIWPPGFYAVEGLAMLLFGATFEVGRCLVFAYFLVAAAYFHALVKRTHGPDVAFVALLVFGLCRIVFTHAGVVMLEVPMLACLLGAMWHLERFLSPFPSGKGAGWLGDLLLLSLWTLATALHRYDAVVIVPYFLIRLALERRLGVLLERRVILCGLAVALLAAPFYYLMIREIGGMQSAAATTGTNTAVSTGFMKWENFYFYPGTVYFQFGHVAAALVVVGILFSFRPARRVATRPYWALVAAVYLTFTPLAELEPRHALVWAPALALFAADAALMPKSKWWRIGLTAALVGSTAFWTLKQEPNWVRGYRPAAAFCVDRLDDTNPVVMFDGLNDGNFVFQVRSLDPARKVWVLRGDKLVYAMKSDPDAGYVAWAKTEEDVLMILHDADPTFVVVEDPPAKPEKYEKMPAAAMLRKVLRERTAEYRLEETFPVTNGNQGFYDGVNLLVYRKLIRNPNRGPIRMNMFWQGSGLTVDPSGKS
jgi:hypothetical protein